MTQDRRPAVPENQIAVQHSNGVYAVQFPGRDPIQYRLDGNGRVQLIEGAAGVQLLPAGRLQVNDGRNIINPYETDTFAFRNPAGDLELVPFTAETHARIRTQAANNPGWDRMLNIQINPLTGDLNRLRSDALERQGRGDYAVRDMDNGGLFELNAPTPVTRTGNQQERAPQTSRGVRD